MNNYFGPQSNNLNNRSNVPQQQQPRRQANYTERPFSDLVDEDKRPFVKRRIISTLLGGYRYVYNEADDESYISWYMHILQILIYLIMPANVVIMTLIFETDRTTGIIIGGLIPLGLNLILQVASYAIQKKINKEQQLARVAQDLSEHTCCSANSFLFLITPRSSIYELTFVILISGIYGALMVYFVHPQTLQFFALGLNQDYRELIITLVVIFFSSYSLFSKPIPESTPYLTNDSFSLFSYHYQRIGYSIILSAILCIIEASQDQPIFMRIISAYDSAFSNILTNFEAFHWLNLALLIAQMFGILGSPMVTIWWALEQIDVHILGSTPRSSDLRTLFSFLLNAVFIVSIILITYYVSYIIGLIMCVVFSFIASHNWFFSLGNLKPHKIVNDKYQQQQEYQTIVFNQTKAKQSIPIQSKNKRGMSRLRLMVGIFLRSLLPYGIVIGLNVIVSLFLILSSEDILGYSGIYVSIIYGMIIAAFVFTCLGYIISFIYRKALFRFIPCCNKQGSPEILVQILKTLIMFCLTLAFSLLSFYQFDVIQLIFLYRAFNRLYHFPFISAIEAFIFFIFMISTKYPIQMPGLPVLILVIVVTTVFNTATIPYLGFAYFIIGYPKPLRGWSAITPVQASANDSRSDGHLYQAMLPQLHKQLQSIFNSDPFNFRVGSYYLLKNEKMIILLQILERGNNYLVYTLKGSELQETTVCHAEENENINQLGEQLFKNNKYSCNIPFSLAPIKTLSFGLYDDQKAALTGIIDNPDFATLVKKVFVRALALKFRDQINSVQGIKYFRIFRGDLTQKEQDTVNKFYDHQWYQHIGYDGNSFAFTFDSIPKSNEQPVKIKPTYVMPYNKQGSLPGVQQKTSFLDMINDNSNKAAPSVQVGGGAVRPMNNEVSAIKHVNSLKQNEEAKNRDIEDDLDGLLSPDKMKKRNNQLPPLEANRSKEGSNLNDLDDLDDFLGNMGGSQKPKPKQIAKPSEDPWGSKPAQTDDWSQPNQNFVAMARNDHIGSIATQPPSQQLSHSPSPASSMHDFQKLIFQSFLLCFREEHVSVPHTLFKLFRGEFTRDLETSDFVSSNDKSILNMKYTILQALRLAFHYSIEAFIMGEFDVPSHQELLKELQQIDQEWFLAGEDYLWNAGIEYGFPSLERIIEKKGSYFAHRLRYGQSEESKFQVYQFRSEVVRSIWANINMELFYYTNANDERFSIQAEKDILRNILVQLAEIPLGYPVYSSGAQIIYY